MRIWFDTEFIEDGRTIDLISIGMVREDGTTYYAELADCALSRASRWVIDHVVPQLTGPRKSRSEVRSDIIEFCGTRPEFWVYYGAYDWVALCQLFGTMMDLPNSWPMYGNDLQQVVHEFGNPALPEQTSAQHHALNDALWTRVAWEFVRRWRVT